MSIGPEKPALHGTQGELISVRISIEPRLLEQLLDVLARLDFPINPQLYHAAGAATVEFPAWGGRLTAIADALRSGLPEAILNVTSMLEALQRVPLKATA